MHKLRVYLLVAVTVAAAFSGSIAAAANPSTDQAVFYVQ